MKRLLFALAVAALLAWLTLPAWASQNSPEEPSPISVHQQVNSLPQRVRK